MKRLSPSTAYILKALIPYTRPNLLLSFTPNKFFNELEKHSKYKKKTLQSAYYRSVKSGLIELDLQRRPSLTKEGRRQLQAGEPAKLKDGRYLVVAFDIPETDRHKRRFIRTLLRELGFEQVQKSVWVSRYRYGQYLKQECRASDLEKYVRIFVARILQ
ncbi:MAG: CRISPR-associated endonuclease Cas2 [Candidatus Saccharimonadales bacterium]